MKRKIRRFYQCVLTELTENKNTFFVYLGLRLLVIIVLVLQAFHHNYENVFLCILTLVLMLMPSVVQATLKVEFPSPLEIIILIFIFSAEILGEINAFYIKFPHWDTILHTLNGFLCAAIGFSLVDIMNGQSKLRFDMSPLFMAITAFCFSMTIGVLWEFFEFGMDRVWGLDMQKDTVIQSIHSTMLDPAGKNKSVEIADIHNVVVDGTPLGVDGYLDIGLIDTMFDLLVNFMGATIFSVIGYFYIKRRDTKSLVSGLLPERWSEDKNSKNR